MPATSGRAGREMMAATFDAADEDELAIAKDELYRIRGKNLKHRGRTRSTRTKNPPTAGIRGYPLHRELAIRLHRWQSNAGPAEFSSPFRPPPTERPRRAQCLPYSPIPFPLRIEVSRGRSPAVRCARRETAGRRHLLWWEERASRK